MQKETIKKAFLKSIPILCSYVFVIIFIDNWEKTKNHAPAVLGLGISVLCLIIAGARSFMLLSFNSCFRCSAFDERKGGTVMKIEFFFLVVAVSAGITFFCVHCRFLHFVGNAKCRKN